MNEMLGLVLFLAVGFVVHRAKYPDGFFPEAPDPELDRLRRLGRRRVGPLPPRETRR